MAAGAEAAFPGDRLGPSVQSVLPNLLLPCAPLLCPVEAVLDLGTSGPQAEPATEVSAMAESHPCCGLLNPLQLLLGEEGVELILACGHAAMG